MTTLSTLKRAALALALVGSTIIVGASASRAIPAAHAAKPVPPTPTPTPTNTATADIVRNTTANKNLSSTGGVSNAVTIVSVTVPAGSWVLSATDDAVNFGPSDYTRCAISAGNGMVGGVTTVVGSPNLSGNMGAGSYVAALATIAPVTSTTSFVASLQCWHDTSTPAGYGPPYIDANAMLWAHPVAALDSAAQ
jgi:hypothetical protein